MGSPAHVTQRFRQAQVAVLVVMSHHLVGSVLQDCSIPISEGSISQKLPCLHLVRPLLYHACPCLVARSERFELPTLGFEVRCSIQLSYERLRGFDYQTWPDGATQRKRSGHIGQVAPGARADAAVASPDDAIFR
jgi:hypothetical protein